MAKASTLNGQLVDPKTGSGIPGSGRISMTKPGSLLNFLPSGGPRTPSLLSCFWRRAKPSILRIFFHEIDELKKNKLGIGACLKIRGFKIHWIAKSNISVAFCLSMVATLILRYPHCQWLLTLETLQSSRANFCYLFPASSKTSSAVPSLGEVAEFAFQKHSRVNTLKVWHLWPNDPSLCCIEKDLIVTIVATHASVLTADFNCWGIPKIKTEIELHCISWHQSNKGNIHTI